MIEVRRTQKVEGLRWMFERVEVEVKTKDSRDKSDLLSRVACLKVVVAV